MPSSNSKHAFSFITIYFREAWTPRNFGNLPTEPFIGTDLFVICGAQFAGTNRISREGETREPCSTRYKEVYQRAVLYLSKSWRRPKNSERPCLRKGTTFMNECKQSEEPEPLWSRAMLCCLCATKAQNRVAQTFQIGGKMQQRSNILVR